MLREGHVCPIGSKAHIDNSEVLHMEAFLALIAAQVILLLAERLLGRVLGNPIRT